LKRRGFTLIELLVVIALIALLGTLTVIGIGRLQIHGKQQQTRLIMQNLESMFSEWDSNRRVPFGMGNFAAFNGLPVTGTPPPPSQQSILAAIYTPCPQNVTLDYNTNAETSSSMPMAPLVAADRKGLDGNVVVPLTRSLMAQFLTSPINAAAIGKLPSGALMTFAGYAPTTPLSWSTSHASTYYAVGQYVTDVPGGNIYIRTQVNLDSSGNFQYDSPTDAPPNYYYWTPALMVTNPTILPSPPGAQGTALPTPVVLDAWGNPIIFVMGGVLGNNPNPPFSTPPAYTLVLDSSHNLVPPIGSGGMITNYGPASVETQVHSPDYHPFFASAGPDGDFSKGDDNIYSYEK
jgi:prepilin-type N-terminal cleavage/methylation domain-containing protein